MGERDGWKMSVEVLERAANAGAHLLKVELRSEDSNLARLAALLLTFDVGRILVRSDPQEAELSIVFIESGAPLPAGLSDGQEEEPWWRVLGSPLTRAWAVKGELAGTVGLQFRADDSAPRIVTLQARGASVSVQLENPPE
jgi:hypothetical protein